MKKILFIVMVTLLVVGCGKSIEEKKNDDQKKPISQEVELLSGYPKDVLPLYKTADVETMKFSRRADLNYTIGKDLYSIGFNSSSTIDEASKYYQSLMNEVEGKGEERFMPTFFSGVVKNQHVNVSIVKLDEESDLIDISLSIGLLESQYVDKNPYFKDYPNNLVEVLYLSTLQEETYEEDLDTKIVYYRTIYQTNKEMSEIMNEYETLYKEKESFKKEEEAKKTIFYWKDQGLDIQLKYEYSGNYKFVNITATKPLNK